MVLLLLSVALATGPLAAQKPLTASKAWVKATAAGETSTTAFVVVENPTMYDVYVMSAQTDAAGSVKFQRAPTSPSAKPEPLEQLTAPAYDSIELKPDGVHMLLSDLKKPLNAGDQVTLFLTTDSGLVIEAIAEVRK